MKEMNMPNSFSHELLLAYLAGVIAGCVGALGVVAAWVVKGRSPAAAWVAAYLVLGAVLGAVSVASDALMIAAGLEGWAGLSAADGGIVHRGLLFGALGSATIGGMDLGLRKILRLRGKIITVRIDSDRSN